MSTMYCECEINSLKKTGGRLDLALAPVGAFKLSFQRDDKPIEYAVLTDNKTLPASGKDSDATLLLLDDGKFNMGYPKALANPIESAMLIAAATAGSKVLIGVDCKAKAITAVELC